MPASGEMMRALRENRSDSAVAASCGGVYGSEEGGGIASQSAENAAEVSF